MPVKRLGIRPERPYNAPHATGDGLSSVCALGAAMNKSVKRINAGTVTWSGHLGIASLAVDSVVKGFERLVMSMVEYVLDAANTYRRGAPTSILRSSIGV